MPLILLEVELVELPGEYALPTGALLVAIEDRQIAGCVGLKTISDKICEMKHLYVGPEVRG